MTEATDRDGRANPAGSGNPCPLCGSFGHGSFRDVDGYSFRKCGECGFVFLDPMPEETVLESIYNQDPVISASFYPKARARFPRALRLALRLLPHFRGRSILDVGCGGGFQVGAFSFFGANASGLDISLASIEYARHRFPACRFYCEKFDEFIKRNMKFGFIHSSEVIEHVVNLSEYMEFLKNITGKGSLVYVTTPDIGSPNVPLDVADWAVFSPPRHVQFFTQDNLTRVFADYGFQPVRRYKDRKTGLKMLFRKT